MNTYYFIGLERTLNYLVRKISYKKVAEKGVIRIIKKGFIALLKGQFKQKLLSIDSILI